MDQISPRSKFPGILVALIVLNSIFGLLWLVGFIMGMFDISNNYLWLIFCLVIVTLHGFSIFGFAVRKWWSKIFAWILTAFYWILTLLGTGAFVYALGEQDKVQSDDWVALGNAILLVMGAALAIAAAIPAILQTIFLLIAQKKNVTCCYAVQDKI